MALYSPPAGPIDVYSRCLRWWSCNLPQLLELVRDLQQAGVDLPQRRLPRGAIEQQQGKDRQTCQADGSRHSHRDHLKHDLRFELCLLALLGREIVEIDQLLLATRRPLGDVSFSGQL